MNRVLIQLIYFVIYSVVFLVIGKLSFSESDSLSKFFVGERKNDEKRLFFTFVGTWVSAATIREMYITADSPSLRRQSSRGLSAQVSCI